MKKTTQVLALLATATLTASIAWAAAPAGAPPAGTAPAAAAPAGAPPAGRAGRGTRGAANPNAGVGFGGALDTVASTNPSAKSLSTPTTPSAQPDANGFIKRWSILDPIYSIAGSNQNTLHANAQKEYFPGQMTVIPKDGDKVTVNGSALTWRAKDTKNHNVSLVHYANDLGISSANGSLFWVVTVVNCPDEMKDVRLAIGSNDGSVWWVNGQEACSIFGDILSYPDDAVSKRLTLKKGPNIIRGVVHNDRGQVDFCARFLDEQGKPIKNFTVTLSVN